jgi:hypothetical protein
MAVRLDSGGTTGATGGRWAGAEPDKRRREEAGMLEEQRLGGGRWPGGGRSGGVVRSPYRARGRAIGGPIGNYKQSSFPSKTTSNNKVMI